MGTDSRAASDARPPGYLGARVVLIAGLIAAGWWAARHPAYGPSDPPAGSLAVRINANEAPWWELAALPRIGPVKAQRIVEHRRRRGRPFTSARDLLEVTGIGPRTVADLEPLLVFH